MVWVFVLFFDFFLWLDMEQCAMADKTGGVETDESCEKTLAVNCPHDRVVTYMGPFLYVFKFQKRLPDIFPVAPLSVPASNEARNLSATSLFQKAKSGGDQKCLRIRSTVEDDHLTCVERLPGWSHTFQTRI